MGVAIVGLGLALSAGGDSSETLGRDVPWMTTIGIVLVTMRKRLGTVFTLWF